MSHKKFGPDRFSRFDVYWIQTDRQTNKQTDRQTNKQTDRQAKFIYRLEGIFNIKIWIEKFCRKKEILIIKKLTER